MAKVIITLHDTEDDGVKVKFDFKPSLNKENVTAAQQHAIVFAAALSGQAEESEVGYEGDE